MKYKKGDHVRHPERPEWGIGEITKMEILTRDGKPDRRLWVKFPSEGTKTLLASIANLEMAISRFAMLASSVLVPSEGNLTQRRRSGLPSRVSISIFVISPMPHSGRSG